MWNFDSRVPTKIKSGRQQPGKHFLSIALRTDGRTASQRFLVKGKLFSSYLYLVAVTFNSWANIFCSSPSLTPVCSSDFVRGARKTSATRSTFTVAFQALERSHFYHSSVFYYCWWRSFSPAFSCLVRCLFKMWTFSEQSSQSPRWGLGFQSTEKLFPEPSLWMWLSWCFLPFFPSFPTPFFAQWAISTKWTKSQRDSIPG